MSLLDALLLILQTCTSHDKHNDFSLVVNLALLLQ